MTVSLMLGRIIIVLKQTGCSTNSNTRVVIVISSQSEAPDNKEGTPAPNSQNSTNVEPSVETDNKASDPELD